VSNDLREMSHLLKLKGFERKWLMPVSRCYLDIHLEGLSSNTENISLNSSQYLSQDLNWTPPKHKSEVQNFRLFYDGMPCRLVIGKLILGQHIGPMFKAQAVQEECQEQVDM